MLKDDATGGLQSGFAATGREVPRDVSVVLLASSRAAGAATEPTMTTLDAPGAEMARLAVEALVARLDAGAGAGVGVGAGAELTQVLLPCVLHVAGSSAPAPSSRAS